jgi:hypothetical protein
MIRGTTSILKFATVGTIGSTIYANTCSNMNGMHGQPIETKNDDEQKFDYNKKFFDSSLTNDIQHFDKNLQMTKYEQRMLENSEKTRQFIENVDKLETGIRRDINAIFDKPQEILDEEDKQLIKDISDTAKNILIDFYAPILVCSFASLCVAVGNTLMIMAIGTRKK